MPNPASSGTGFLDVRRAWLQIFDEQEGGAYMDRLHQNIGQYCSFWLQTPRKMAASGNTR